MFLDYDVQLVQIFVNGLSLVLEVDGRLPEGTRMPDGEVRCLALEVCSSATERGVVRLTLSNGEYLALYGNVVRVIYKDKE